MKKILALILTTVMLLSSIVIPANAADEVELTLTARENGLLCALGITYNPDPGKIYATNNATRGIVAYYVARMVNEDNSVSSGFEAIFYDVTSEHQYYKEIRELKNAGIMNGYPNGKFGPNDPISSKEMALVLARIFGYSPYVSAMGLDAYIRETKITEGVGIKEELQVQDVLKMIYNGLHAPVMEMSSVGTKGADFAIDEKYLGLDFLYDIVYAKGIVDGARNTRLASPDTTISTDEMMIDGERFVYSKGSSEDYLGYFSEYYYREKNGKNEIIYIAKSKRNGELVLESNILEDFSNGTFKYADLKNNDYETVDVADDIDVIINGVANPAYTDEEMIPHMGSVTLIDNNNDRKYDVVKIDSYEFYLVKNVDLKNDIIYDKTEGKKLDLKNADDYRITWDGDEYSLDRLIEGSFLIVKRTNPASGFYYADIEVRKDERTYTEIEKVDLNNDYIRGGGTAYTVWNNLDEESRDNLEKGAWVTLYFCNEVVVRVEKSSSDGGSQFGYLVNIASEGVFDAEISFLIVDKAGTPATYTMGKSLKIDESSYKNFEDISSKLAQTAQLSAYYLPEYPYSQPVKYELNANSKVITLDTAYFDGEREDSEDSLSFTTSGTLVYEYANIYDSGRTTHYATNGATTSKIKIPLTNRLDLDAYNTGGLSEGDACTIEVYNRDEKSFVAGAIYSYKDTVGNEITRRTRPIIVQDTSVMADEEGEVAYSITCLDQKAEVRYNGPRNLLENIEVGDLIRVGTDKQGVINDVEMVWDASEGSPAKANRVISFSGSASEIPRIAGYKFVYMLPTYMEGAMLRTTTSLPCDEDFDPNYKTDNFSIGSIIYKYSETRGIPSVGMGSASDIQTYANSPESPSEIIIYTYNGSLQFVYVIEK